MRFGNRRQAGQIGKPDPPLPERASTGGRLFGQRHLENPRRGIVDAGDEDHRRPGGRDGEPLAEEVRAQAAVVDLESLADRRQANPAPAGIEAPVGNHSELDPAIPHVGEEQGLGQSA